MSLFDDLMKSASSFANKINPKPSNEESVFKKIGRIPLTALGIAPAMSTPDVSNKETTQDEPQSDALNPDASQKDVVELPPLITRDIPDGAQIIGQEAIDLYPQDSDVGQIIQRGYSLVTDPTNGTVLGASDKYGNFISPDEALSQKPVQQILQESGYQPIPDNVTKFLKQNRTVATDIKNLNFSGLLPDSDNVVVKSPMETVLDTVYKTPVMQTLAVLKNPLEIIGDGFARYEALKTSLIQDAAVNPIRAVTQSIKSLQGTAETEFPEASLRTGKSPEMGDLLRKMGMPELAAAIGGLGLDVLTDGVVLGLAGKGLKETLRGMKFGEQNGLEYVTERWNNFRGQKAVGEIEDMLKGKRAIDVADAPEFVQRQRQIMGEAHVGILDSTEAAKELDRYITKTPEIIDDATSALAGDSDKLVRLAPEVQTVIRQARSGIDKTSSEVANQIRLAISGNPSFEKELRASFVGGEKIPAAQLPEIIAQNEGSYVKRAYQIFMDKNYKPAKESFDKAVRGLVEEFDLSEKDAIDKVEEILRKKEVHLPAKKELEPLRIKQGSFIARQQIPSYIRELMGEITDPRYNIINTQRSLSDSLSKFRLFKLIKDLGLASTKESATHSVAVKAGDSLAWGAIKGHYLTKEVDNMLTAITATDKVLDSLVVNSMQFIKGMKTIGNPSTHIHNFLGNAGLFAGLADITPFDPGNFKHYKKAAEILMDAKKVMSGKLSKESANFKLYRQMIEDTVLGTELPVADQIKFVDELIKDPFHTRKTNVIRRGVENIFRGAAEAYAMEDQVFKAASYLKNIEKGMTRSAATDELYKWFPNYAEASRFATYARNSASGLLFLNPFMTFRSEAHRIFLNAIKGGTPQHLWLTGYLGGRGAANVAMLLYAGHSMKDIKEYFMSKPEAVSEAMMNPAAMDSGEFDINWKYIDPINTKGLFAPLLAHSGATGVSPFDYLLDFTNFSPEFGYSNLLVNSIEEFATGRGRFGQELSGADRMNALIKGVGPTALTTNLPKILDSEQEATERIRRGLRFFGIDVEKRNPDWIKSTVRKRLEQKIAKGEDPEATINAINAIGFDASSMVKEINRRLQRGNPIKKKKPSSTDTAVSKALEAYGF